MKAIDKIPGTIGEALEYGWEVDGEESTALTDESASRGFHLLRRREDEPRLEIPFVATYKHGKPRIYQYKGGTPTAK